MSYRAGYVRNYRRIDGEIKHIALHENFQLTDVVSYDGTINDIYTWIEEVRKYEKA